PRARRAAAGCTNSSRPRRRRVARCRRRCADSLWVAATAAAHRAIVRDARRRLRCPEGPHPFSSRDGNAPDLLFEFGTRMDPNKITALIEQNLPGARAEVSTDGQGHYEATVIS